MRMSKDEYRVKMRELGWDDDYIENIIKIHDEDEKNGISLPYEMDLVEAPHITNYVFDSDNHLIETGTDYE